MVKYNDFSRVGNFFDLDECQKAYELGGKNTHWTEFTIDGDFDDEAYFAVFDYWWKKLPLEEQKRIHFEVKCKHIKIHLNWSVPKDFDPAIHNMPPTEIDYPNMAFPTKEFRSLSQYVNWVADGYSSKNGFHLDSYEKVMC
jgi:hypothetical protein